MKLDDRVRWKSELGYQVWWKYETTGWFEWWENFPVAVFVVFLRKKKKKKKKRKEEILKFAFFFFFPPPPILQSWVQTRKPLISSIFYVLPPPLFFSSFLATSSLPFIFSPFSLLFSEYKYLNLSPLPLFFFSPLLAIKRGGRRKGMWSERKFFPAAEQREQERVG
eukprot:TRINITY_DN1333_c8_g1_i1.p1 TRINITY_DN1333_c8_g1~~TRINITY_DN1333_c8_g1_i1.p1  ORF type:complete len:166 (+),score=10.27 TRINITY_DN1333_c8_g1_i1:227-724(+)